MHKKQNQFNPSGIKWPTEVDMLLNITQTPPTGILFSFFFFLIFILLKLNIIPVLHVHSYVLELCNYFRFNFKQASSEELWYFSGWGTRWQGCTLTYVPPCLTRICFCSHPMTKPSIIKIYLIKENIMVFCMIVIPVLTWWWSAHLNFSKDSHFINCFQPACMALRLLATTSLVETTSNVGSLSFRK